MAADRSTTERLLRQTEERFRSVFTNAPTGISITDWEGRFEQCNPAYATIVGIPADELMGRSFPDLVHPEDRAANMALTAELRRGEIPYFEIENRYRRPDGTVVWVHKFVSTIAHDDGVPTHLLAIVTDITERRRYDEDLRASEERFRATFELAPIGVAHVGLDGTFIRVNETLAAITGHEREHLETLRFPDVTHPDDIDEDLAYVEQLLRGEINRYSMEKRYLRPDGSAVWVNLTGTLVRDDAGEPTYFVAVVEDVMERRAAREHLARIAETEHEVALRLQQALLPHELASTDTLTVAGRYEPADARLQVGGDWYDSLLLPDGRVLLVVGDVVGHGLDAAAVMGRLRAGLAALTSRESRPSALLTAFDDFARGPQGADFATVCCAVVDPTDGSVLHASAGHPPMLIVDADGATRWLDDATSPPLCHGTGLPRTEGADRLAPGETIVLYSDGLIERRGRGIVEGLGLLEHHAIALRHHDVPSVCDGLVASMQGTSPSTDDVVVLVARFEPRGNASFSHRMTATATELAPMRRALRRWAETVGLADSALRDLLLVVGEACANAIEHAYVGREPGSIEVAVEIDGTTVVASVSDRGVWRAAGEHSAVGGRGTSIIASLTSAYERSTDGGGTRVTMRLPTTDQPDETVSDG